MRKLKLKILKNRPARAATQTSLKASANAPDSGSQALNNSHASSAALAELASSISFAIDQLDYDAEEPGDMLQLHLERLADEVSKYQNSRLTPGMGQAWTCPDDVAQVLYASCLCSIAVYDSSPEASMPGAKISCVGRSGPSLDGTLKCTALWTIDRAPDDTLTTKELIVSIRGSSKTVDHIVNLNGSEKDVESFFCFPESTTAFKAHTGFLSCAEALLPDLSKEIIAQIQQSPRITDVIFTGHSSGGAVASLLFLHFVTHTPEELSSQTFSLTTFGSAPVTSPNVTSLCQNQPNVGLALSIVNENDMVARADGPYLRSIIDLYRARFGLPPSLTHTDSGMSTVSRLALQGPSIGSRGVWPLPDPMFHLVGDVVLLSDPELSNEEHGRESGEDVSVAPAASVRSIAVSHEDFGKLLSCDIGVHRRRAYLETVKALWLGICQDSPTGQNNKQQATTANSLFGDTSMDLEDHIISLYT